MGKAINGFGILLVDFAKGRRGGNPEVSLPTEEAAYQPDGLQVGDVGLQEDAIDRADFECHMVPE
jgi:hypothetical protein